jgi:hypothetical protein
MFSCYAVGTSPVFIKIFHIHSLATIMHYTATANAIANHVIFTVLAISCRYYPAKESCNAPTGCFYSPAYRADHFDYKLNYHHY